MTARTTDTLTHDALSHEALTPAPVTHDAPAQDALPPDFPLPDALPPEPAPHVPPPRTGFAVAADGSYAACLADAGAGTWYPERWTLGGPEPYTVPLPGNQPEEPDAQVLPLPDGRVLIRRGSGDRHGLALLYPTGHGTGELPVGFLHGTQVRLLPPSASGTAYALTYADGVSTVWLVHGGPGLDKRAELSGRCTGGVWLDRAGRLLALDREREGRTKTVTVDLATGEVSPLLQITEDSDDRLLLADPDSGLLLVRSDAPGADRLGWGVLGSRRPVRFPECLREPETADGGRAPEPMEPVAVEPGHPLAPESCAVVLRTGGHGVLWRPSARHLDPLPTPAGWLAGHAWWPAPGTLRLPYARAGQPYGVRDIATDHYAPAVYPHGVTRRTVERGLSGEPGLSGERGPSGDLVSVLTPVFAPALTPGPGSVLAGHDRAIPGPGAPVSRVLPLQQAPLAGAPR